MSHHAFYDVIVDIVRLISTDDGSFLMGVLALWFPRRTMGLLRLWGLDETEGCKCSTEYCIIHIIIKTSTPLEVETNSR